MLMPERWGLGASGQAASLDSRPRTSSIVFYYIIYAHTGRAFGQAIRQKRWTCTSPSTCRTCTRPSGKRCGRGSCVRRSYTVRACTEGPSGRRCVRTGAIVEGAHTGRAWTRPSGRRCVRTGACTGFRVLGFSGFQSGAASTVQAIRQKVRTEGGMHNMLVPEEPQSSDGAVRIDVPSWVRNPWVRNPFEGCSAAAA
jgi:hypothetical protein